MTRLRQFLPALALPLASCASGGSADTAYLRQFIDAERAAKPFAPVTEARPDMTIAEAYRVQSKIIALRVHAGDTVAGYKGGLMSDASLRARGVSEPLVGVLFASGRMPNGATVSACGYRRAAFEAKLGYVFAHGVDTSTNSATIRRAIAAIVPVIDLPDIGYRDPDKYGAVDMVAANVSAARWVTGRQHAPGTADLDQIGMKMTHDGKQVAVGLGRESLGSQWESVRMLVARIGATGRRVRAGDIVITGKIGEKGWLRPGVYRADYGPLGAVAFTVAACPHKLASVDD